jgi:transposase-like protein
MKERTVIRYSVSFKQQVVEDLESGRFGSIAEAQSFYGIRGMDTVKRWLWQYGRNHLCAKVVRVEKPNEKDQIRELKRQIHQLKEALGDSQVEKWVGDEFLKIACKKLGEDVEEFKKKADMMLRVERERKQK